MTLRNYIVLRVAEPPAAIPIEDIHTSLLGIAALVKEDAENEEVSTVSLHGGTDILHLEIDNMWSFLLPDKHEAKGFDPYLHIAASFFGVSLTAVTPEMRNQAKALTYAYLYGAHGQDNEPRHDTED
jgi:hypothetical protein